MGIGGLVVSLSQEFAGIRSQRASILPPEMIDPKDIAALAVFLASDAAKAISGQVIPIDNDRQRA